MSRNRRVNLPLIEVLVGSLVFHVVLLLLFGGMTLYRIIVPEQPEFEAPPVVEQPNDPQELKIKVSLQKSSQQSAPPIQRIMVQNVSLVNLPKLSDDLPNPQVRVAVGVGAGNGSGAGLGRGFGAGNLDLSKSAVTFFGLKSSGERIMIIVDASRYMLEDKKGGLPAYQLIKEEVRGIVQGLSAGTLFNVIFYNEGASELYAQTMLPATQSNKDAFGEWVGRFNKDMSSIANVRSNASIADKSVEPMLGQVNAWVKAYQIAQEQNADAIFLLVSGWQYHPRFKTAEERQAFLLEKGWTTEDSTKWSAAVNQAQAWLAEENAKRRAKGVPEKITHDSSALVSELVKEGVIDKVRFPPGESFSAEEIIDYTEELGRKYAKQFNRNPSPTNIVLFLGEDEDKDSSTAERFKDVARENRGRFRVLQGLKALKNVSTLPPAS